MSDTMRYFDLTKTAPVRLAMLRAAFAGHAKKYPHCPEPAKPRSWRDIRGTNHKSVGAYCGTLSQGFNGADNYKTHIWYSHTGEQFRGERYADEITEAYIRHTGWFTDTFQDEKARGIVARLTHGRFIAGYHWSANNERVYFPEVYDNESEAARASDSHAESFAESAREDSERFGVMMAAELGCEEKLVEVQKAFALRHHAKFGGMTRVIKYIDELRSAREELAQATRDYEKGE